MFNFIKKGVNVAEKDDEKEKRKRDKKMRKEGKQAGLSTSMSTEELLRLDEVSTPANVLQIVCLYTKQTTTIVHTDSTVLENPD